MPQTASPIVSKHSIRQFDFPTDDVWFHSSILHDEAEALRTEKRRPQHTDGLLVVDFLHNGNLRGYWFFVFNQLGILADRKWNLQEVEIMIRRLRLKVVFSSDQIFIRFFRRSKVFKALIRLSIFWKYCSPQVWSGDQKYLSFFRLLIYWSNLWLTNFSEDQKYLNL